MKEACLPLGALLLLSWTLLVNMEPQRQESRVAEVEVPGGEGLRTSFSCHGRIQGYYADIETGCRLYHLCDETGRQFTHACPNLTLFQQRMMICDHWYMVNCSASIVDYAANLLLGQRDQPFLKPEDQLHQQHLQYQQRQRVTLPATFSGEAAKTQGASATREHPVKTSAASSKRKATVNSGKTVSFSISSLSAASQEDYYRRTQGRTKSPRRPVQNSRLVTNQDSVPVRFPSTESTTVPVSPSTLYDFSGVSDRGGSNRYKPEVTQTTQKTNQETYQIKQTYQPTQKFESSSPRTKSNSGASDIVRDYNIDQAQNVYRGLQQFSTSTPRSISNFHTSGVKSSSVAGQYSDRTNPFSLTTPSPSNKYANNPYFQNYFKSSTTAVPPVFNIEEDEDEYSGNRIEIILEDPRRMFFIPDSDFDLNSALDAKNSTVLVIPVPHHHGAMRFRSYDRFAEGRNPECPRCHPAFLLPGQCQPCVLIK